MVAIVDPRPTDRVYDPICGSEQLLATAGGNLRFQGVDEPEVFGQAR
jgi:type I restriction-modification system DNA methylase subunit